MGKYHIEEKWTIFKRFVLISHAKPIFLNAIEIGTNFFTGLIIFECNNKRAILKVVCDTTSNKKHFYLDFCSKTA